MRLDKYMKVSRLIKRRTVANEVADAGRILINGKVAKASQAVNAGDIIEVTFGNRPIKVRVLSEWSPAPRTWPARCTRSSSSPPCWPSSRPRNKTGLAPHRMFPEEGSFALCRNRKKDPQPGPMT